MTQLPSVPSSRLAESNVTPLLNAAVPLVLVQQDWSGWRKAWIPVSSLEDVHWHQPAGAPKPLVHGYVSCAALVSGDLPHDCVGTTAHRLLVCVLRRHTAACVFDTLVQRANLAASSGAAT
jgi:hypothetical protein